MAAWNEAPAAGGLGECAALVRSAEALRFSAPELAVQLARRALAVGAEASKTADVGETKALSMRAQALLATGLVRMSHYADAVEPAFAALALAEGEGKRDVATSVRLDLAVCSREVGEPLLGCALLRPVLESEQPNPSVRAIALGRLVGCIAHVGRRDDIEDALTEADRLLAADDGLNPEMRRMERARLSVRAAAYHRWYGDTEDAAEAAREGLTQLNRLRGLRAETSRLRAQLVLELACALLDDGELDEAASVSETVLSEPVRATSAAAAGRLMLAVSTRVYLPSGRVDRGRGLLDQAVWVADRHGLDELLADALTAVSQLDEGADRPVEALESLHAARAAEQRRLRATAQAARRLLTEANPAKWNIRTVNALLRKVVLSATPPQQQPHDDWRIAAQRVTQPRPQAPRQAAPTPEPRRWPSESSQPTLPPPTPYEPNRSVQPSAAHPAAAQPTGWPSEEVGTPSPTPADATSAPAPLDATWPGEATSRPDEETSAPTQSAEWRTTPQPGEQAPTEHPAGPQAATQPTDPDPATPALAAARTEDEPVTTADAATSYRTEQAASGAQSSEWSVTAQSGEQSFAIGGTAASTSEQAATEAQSAESAAAGWRAELWATAKSGEDESAPEQQKSDIDAATGLLNQEGMIRRLRAVRNGERPVALTLVRLDGDVGTGRFVDPGTRPGTAAEFELSELAGRVRNLAPEDAELARFDGTELAVLLPHTTRDQAEKFAAEIESAWLRTSNGQSISTGVVQSNPDTSTVDARALINAARHALTPAIAVPSRGAAERTPRSVEELAALDDDGDTLRIGREIIRSLSIPEGSGGKRRAADSPAADQQSPESDSTSGSATPEPDHFGATQRTTGPTTSTEPPHAPTHEPDTSANAAHDSATGSGRDSAAGVDSATRIGSGDDAAGRTASGVAPGFGGGSDLATGAATDMAAGFGADGGMAAGIGSGMTAGSGGGSDVAAGAGSDVAAGMGSGTAAGSESGVGAGFGAGGDLAAGGGSGMAAGSGSDMATGSGSEFSGTSGYAGEFAASSVNDSGGATDATSRIWAREPGAIGAVASGAEASGDVVDAAARVAAASNAPVAAETGPLAREADANSSTYEETKAELARMMLDLVQDKGTRSTDVTPLPAPSRPVEDHAGDHGHNGASLPRLSIPTPPEPDDVPEPERRPDVPQPPEPEPIPPVPPDPGPQPPDEPGPLAPPSATERPGSIERPSATGRPSATQGPGVTERRSATEQPSATERRSAVEGPGITEGPGVAERRSASATERPGATERRSAAERQGATERPGVNELPGVTERPSAADRRSAGERRRAGEPSGFTARSNVTRLPNATRPPTTMADIFRDEGADSMDGQGGNAQRRADGDRRGPGLAAAFGGREGDNVSAEETTGVRRAERSSGSTTIAGLLAEALAAYQEESADEPAAAPAKAMPPADNDFDRLFDWRYQSPASGRHRSPE